MKTNLRPGLENSGFYAFGSAMYMYLIHKRYHFIPVSCKWLQKFHTGLSSSRSYVITPLFHYGDFYTFFEVVIFDYLSGIVNDGGKVNLKTREKH